jgi:hypothetical protein
MTAIGPAARDVGVEERCGEVAQLITRFMECASWDCDLTFGDGGEKQHRLGNAKSVTTKSSQVQRRHRSFVSRADATLQPAHLRAHHIREGGNKGNPGLRSRS